MASDIMGAVYERFLAHKLAAEQGRITIEDTDELRKTEGIYYTPRSVVDYIVARTVSEKIKPILNEALALLGYKIYEGAVAKIRELQHIKVLDPAMGSASFLLRAFDAFVEAYAAYNAECAKQKNERGQSTGMLFDSPQEIPEAVDHLGIRVASENIFGVDLDEQAVEVAKLNLWIRLMTAERDFIRETLRVRTNGQRALNLLPTLADNLKRGNSLIAAAAVAGEAAFDWQTQFPQIMQRGGFDCVVGNPPYRMLQPHNTTEELLAHLRGNYVAAEFKLDLYHLFLQRAVSFLRVGGHLGFILPTPILNNVYAESLREWLLEHCCIERIAVARDKVFADADVHTSIIILRRESDESTRARHEVLTTTGFTESFQDKPDAYSQTQQARFSELPGHVWNVLVNERNGPLIKKLTSRFTPLSRIGVINRGLITGDREKFFSTTKKSPDYVPLLQGGDVHRYWVAEPSQFVRLEKPDSAGGSWDAKIHLAPHKILIRQIAECPTASIIQAPF